MNIRHFLTTATAATALLASAHAAVHAQAGYGAGVATADGAVFVAEPSNIVRSGIVYVYAPDGSGAWIETAQLTAPGAQPGDRFGSAIAADATTMLASRAGENDGRGAVYVFERRGASWERTGVIAPDDRAADDSVGTALAIAGDVAVISAAGAGDAGAVYVFTRSGGAWTQTVKLTGSDAAADDRYGASVAVLGDRLLVGAPGQAENRGAAYLYERAADGSWRETAKLVSRTVSDGSLLGASVALLRDYAIAGAPGRDESTGAVYLFERNPQEEGWAAYTRLFPWDGGSQSQFGAALSIVDDELWVASPGTDGYIGTIYRFAWDAEREEWMSADKFSPPADAAPGGFAYRLAAAGALGVASVPGANQGEGGVAFLGRDAAGEWSVQGAAAPEPEVFPAVTGGVVECSSGKAGMFECGGDVQLLSFLPIPDIGGERGVNLNDIWGWTDAQTGREYALVGRTNGTSFVDVTDPSNPRYLGDLPMTDGAQANAWRDIKVYRDHAYIVADGSGTHGMQVFDLSKLRNVSAPQTFTADTVYRQIFSAHNIVINEESGFAFAVGSNSGGE
ncbi:MAG: choice-of-anchor B family protein, partial [Longimicrobiales bacterium]